MDRIGPYLIQRKLGTGGMGAVYLADHEQTAERAAVKLLPASLAREPGFLARFDREIAALRQLTNPHVVRIFDSGTIPDETDEENTAYYYAMEYVEGETLLTKLRREKRLPWETVIDYGVQICVALKAAHDAGIIHRDLKPSNLLMSDDGQVKLADFGVAQVFASTRLTKTGGIIGTAEFMSPEQAQGHRATKKSDLYALGVVLYTMLAGRPPYSGQTMLDVLHQHQFGQYDSPRHFASDCPRWLEDAIAQLLEKNPDNRPANAYITGRRLQEIPKKVALSQSEPLPTAASRSVVASQPRTEFEQNGHDDLLDSHVPLPDDAPTRTAPGIPSSAEEGGARRGPGGATIMHTLMRDELARQQETHPIQKFFDNTWVLLGILVLLLLGGWMWYQNLPTPESHYAEARRLIAAGEYSQARYDHLYPLLDEEGDWPEKAQRLIDKIEQLEEDGPQTKKDSSNSKDISPVREDMPPVGEAGRLLERAKALAGQGRIEEARKMLGALIALTEGSDEAQPVRREAIAYQDALPGLEEEVQQSREAFVRDVLKRAAALRAAGEQERAQQLEVSLQVFYGGSDDGVDLEQVRQDLARESGGGEE